MNDEKAKTLSEDNPFLSIEKNVKETKEYIAQNHMLPESTSVLLTTSTLREGVNLKDENIKIAFCESHLLSDIQQFAGRVRNGLDVLYVVENAQQHCIDFESLRKEQQELLESIFYGIESKNEYMERFITGVDAFDKSPVYICFDYGEENLFYYRFAGVGDFSLFTMGNTAVRDHINLTESNHKYIRFNHLSSKYELYVTRISSGYNKSNNIYGLWENRDDIEKAGYVVVVESEKSVLKRYSLLDHTVVALSGKFMSEEQKRILLELDVQEIVIALDKDVSLTHVREICEELWKNRKVSYIYDDFGILGEKDSPADARKTDYEFLFIMRVEYDEAEHQEFLKGA